MQLKLEADKRAWQAGEIVVVRLVIVNDAYEPAACDRRLLVGPNPVVTANGAPYPISLEPEIETANQIWLNPWCFYGRARSFEYLAPGEVTFHGYYLNQPSTRLYPEKPVEAELAGIFAEPLTLTILD